MTMLNHWLYNIIQQWVNLAVSVKYYLARVADLSVAFSDKKNVFITTLWLHVYFTVYIIFITSLFNVKEVPFNIWQKGETFKNKFILSFQPVLPQIPCQEATVERNSQLGKEGMWLSGES